MEQMLPQGPNTSHCSHPHDILSIHHYLMKDYYYYWHSGECVSCWVMSTLCDSMDWGPPDSSVHEISQDRILEWVAIPFSRVSSQPRNRTQVSCIAGRLFTNWGMREAQIAIWTASDSWSLPSSQNLTWPPGRPGLSVLLLQRPSLDLLCWSLSPAQVLNADMPRGFCFCSFILKLAM